MYQDEPLDVSWKYELNRTINSEDHPLRESLDYITIQYFYVSKQGSVIHTIVEKHEFTDNGSGLDDLSLFRTMTNEKMLYLIQSKKMHNGIRYKCMDSYLFLVDIEPNGILDFSRDGSRGSFVQEVSLLKPVSFPPSIFVFHSVNRLYFIFREMTLVEPLNKVGRNMLGSEANKRLDGIVEDKSKKPSTKKVRISPDAIIIPSTIVSSKNKTVKVRKDT
jgi:hypothetical protein